MRELFLLGAGFSKAVYEGMPLMGELGERLRAEVPFPGEKELATGFTGDLEVWLSYLAQAHPWLTEAANLRNRALFLDVAAAIGKVLGPEVHEAIRRGFPAWFQNLVAYWHETSATVVSLNYDTLIEECLNVFPVREYPLVGIGRRANSRPGLRQVYPVPLEGTGPDTVLQDVCARHSKFQTLRLLKLHGSINWFYSGSRAFSAEPIHVSMTEAALRWNRNAVLPPPLPQPTEGLVPLIAPPIADKSPFFENRVISLLWKRAASALANSERVYCLGYSLPEADLTVRYWLASAHRKNTPTALYVVNPDAAGVEHYRCLLPHCYQINNSFAGSPDSIQRLVGALIKADPDALLSGPAGLAATD